MFISDSSYLRKNGTSLIHAHSKFFTIVNYDGNETTIQFQRQNPTKMAIYSDKNQKSTTVNGEKSQVDYGSNSKLFKFIVKQ